MPNRATWDLLTKYVSGGQLTPAEQAAFERRLASNPELAREVAFARQMGERTADLAEPDVAGDPTAVWIRIATLIAAAPAPVSKRLPWVRTNAWRIAAAVALVSGVGVLWRVSSPSSHSTPGTPAGRAYTTTAGQRASLRLPDGTQVVLAPASVLRLASTYGTRERAVQLVGQAAFTVHHDARRPFVVHAANLTATDLGTEFVVRAYPDDANAEVVVREGIVAIRGAGHALPVHAGEKGRLSAAGTPIVKQADVATEFAWTEGRLVFQAAPLSTVAVHLSRWYAVDIRLASPGLGSLPLTAVFDSQAAEDAVDRIARSLGLTVTRTTGTFTLSR